MNNEVVTFEIQGWFGNKTIPIQVTIKGKYLVIAAKYFAPLVEELKAMDKPSDAWDNVNKTWTVYNNKRNLFALSVIQKKGAIEHYLRDYDHYVIDGFWHHQCDMYSFVTARRRCILAAEMRTGKTRPTMKAFTDSEWPFAIWLSPLKPIMGLNREYLKWGVNKPIHFMTYEHFREHSDEIVARWNVPGFLVLDECHKLKTPSAEVSQTVTKISELMMDTHKGKEFIVGLSGTPAPRDPSDWWNICEIVQPGFIKESSKPALARRLGNYEQRMGAVGNQYWHLINWKEDEVAKMYKRLKGLVQVHLKKDCLDLPPIRYEIRELTPSKELLRVAKTIVNSESNILTATQKLRQLSDGFMYETTYNEDVNRKERSTTFVGSPKIEQLCDDLDTISDSSEISRVVVYTGFQGSVDIIKGACIEKGWVVLQVDGRGWQIFTPIDTPTDISVDGRLTVDFLLGQMDRSSDTGEVKKLAVVGQADSAGMGLEFSSAGTIIYYSNSDRGDSRMQSEARAHSDNMDKERGLTVIDYCLLPTDKKIRDRLMMKKDLQSLSMGELKQVFATVSSIEE
jgi:hypothetical protein